MPFFVLFFIIPLIEISLFIAVGDEIGIFPTLMLCVVTAVVGATILREQGFQTWAKAQNSLRQGQMPVNELYTGFCLVIAGAFLMTPGFFTDTVGFLLLVPRVRSWLLTRLKPYFKARGRGYRPGQDRGQGTDSDAVIDVEFEEVDNDNAPPENTIARDKDQSRRNNGQDA